MTTSEQSFQVVADAFFKEESSESVAENKGSVQPLLEDFQCLNQFEDAFEFISFFDESINNGTVTLHKWQVEELIKVSTADASSKHPYKYCLCAANGSGKDAFFVAPLVLHFICCNIKSLVIITSSSGTQLTSQTETYIRELANKINKCMLAIYGQEILKINQRHIRCLLSGSEIRLFATDEESKAEGFHPKEPGKKFLIVVNEAKSVAPEIFRALRRCTGFSHWLNVSTPGEPQGDFHDSFFHWPNKRKITYYDCPHQAPDEFEEDKRRFGEHSSWFRSKWLAEFGYIGGKYVIPKDRLDKMRQAAALGKIPVVLFDTEPRVGIDIALSTGGDETVISIFRGNRHKYQFTHRIKDATLLADAIECDLKKSGIKKDSEHIFADDCGVGRAVIDILRQRGWNIKRVRNNDTARNKHSFRNRGAELWHKFARFVEECGLHLIDDDVLYAQLASRKYKETEAGIDKLQLEGKQAMIASGSMSPDRADACVLAFTDVPIDTLLDALERALEGNMKEEKKREKTPEEILEELEAKMFLDDAHPKTHRRSFGSANSILNKGKRVRIHLGKWS